MKALKLILTSLMILTATTMAQAGDASVAKVVGFSKDGKNFAFLQDGIQDGSGFYWAQVDVIDVNNNKLLKRVALNSNDLFSDQGEGTTPAQEKAIYNEVLKRANLNHYQIDQKIKGKTVLERPYTDFSTYTNTVFSLDYWAQGGASTTVETYSLTVREQAAPVEQHNEWCQDFINDTMITVEVKGPLYGNYHNNSRTITLQKDLRVPSSRSCAYGYSVKQIISYKKGIVALVNYQAPGFEGPNYRFIAVTGQLNH